MNLKLNLHNPPYADGQYDVSARGYKVASLHWADQNGPLADWTALAHLPLDASGRGRFSYTGGRAIPPQATHVAAKVISADFQRQETLLVQLPSQGAAPSFQADTTLAVMSALHRESMGYMNFLKLTASQF